MSKLVHLVREKRRREKIPIRFSLFFTSSLIQPRRPKRRICRVQLL
jgi:hypothetical protein